MRGTRRVRLRARDKLGRSRSGDCEPADRPPVPAKARPFSLSPRAIRDSAAIDAYYAQFGLVTADRVVATIKAAAESVRLNPLIASEGIRKGTRYKVIGR